MPRLRFAESTSSLSTAEATIAPATVRRPSVWSSVAMLGGIGLFAAAPTVVEASFDLNFPIGSSSVPLSILAAGVALAGAAILRRPLWLASLLVALTAGLGGFFVFSRGMIAVATPWGDELYPKEFQRSVPLAYARVLKTREADLAYLLRGTRAVQSGKPFTAPEGGYLLPVEFTTHPGYDSGLRFEATDRRDLAQRAWEDMLARTQHEVNETRLRATMPLTPSPAAWLRYGLFYGAIGLLAVVAANLAALLSRALFGGRR